MQREGRGSRYILCLALSALVVLMQSHISEGSFYIDWNDINFTEADLQELDALYPIARYAGMGYNILRGNPEGDFVQGGRDPGIHDTRWIFNLTYMSNKEVAMAKRPWPFLIKWSFIQRNRALQGREQKLTADKAVTRASFNAT